MESDLYHDWFMSLTEFEQDVWRCVVEWAEANVSWNHGEDFSERTVWAYRECMTKRYWGSVLSSTG